MGLFPVVLEIDRVGAMCFLVKSQRAFELSALESGLQHFSFGHPQCAGQEQYRATAGIIFVTLALNLAVQKGFQVPAADIEIDLKSGVCANADNPQAYGGKVRSGAKPVHGASPGCAGIKPDTVTLRSDVAVRGWPNRPRRISRNLGLVS